MKITQEQIDKFQMLVDACAGKIEIEICLDSKDDWVKYEVGNYKFHLTDVMDSILSYPCEIRIAKKIPMLSDEDAEFADKYLPHHWWIVRDVKGILSIANAKPSKVCDILLLPGQSHDLNMFTFPWFGHIKWEDDDCYTIQELLDNYKKVKGIK